MTPRAYYNEIDPFAAAWLRVLIADGHIAPGEVDERSIVEITPRDLAGFTQCHFFAGIGVWSYALRRAGWADARPAWTGSCPCQPFSAAGAQDGFSDARHLWPAWFELIRECAPPIVFGEQVASPLGLHWLDVVSSDLESASYAVGAADIGAASVGAPHIRQRLYFVADAAKQGFDGRRASGAGDGRDASRLESERLRNTRGLADADGGNASTEREQHGGQQRLLKANGGVSRMADAGRDGDLEHARELSRDESEYDVGRANGDHTPVARGATGGLADDDDRRREECGAARLHDYGECRDDAPRRGADGRMGDAAGRGRGELGNASLKGNGGHAHGASGLPSLMGHAERARLEGYGGHGDNGHEPGRIDARATRPAPTAGDACEGTGPTNGLWRAADWLLCTDGKWRPVEPGTFPLAHGAPARVGRLRGYGNAINAEVAATFVEAYLDTIEAAPALAEGGV